MIDFKYKLDNSSKKFQCPQCNKKTLVKFKDDAGEYLSDHSGRCDRENNCGYFLGPNGSDNRNLDTSMAKPIKVDAFVPDDILADLLNGYNENDFLNNLLKAGYPKENINQLISDYYLGTITTGKYKGSICFPFISDIGLVTAVQIKKFKNFKTIAQSWIHSILNFEHRETKKQLPEWLQKYNENDKYVRSLFGAHLLKRYPEKHIIIVESPKNALIGALNQPKFLWLSTFNFSMIKNQNVFKCLQGRTATLLPDNSQNDEAFFEWERQAFRFRRDLSLQIDCSDFLLDKCSDEDKKKGFDIADYYLTEITK